ncbi:hypothetical protein Tco_0796628 [Tanacetum coccineum]
MANQEQIPPQQDQPERPESPIPFEPATQVGFHIEDIIFNPNNEIALGILGEVGVNTFRNAIGTHYLPYSSEYVASPTIENVRKWFPIISIDYASLIWEDIISKLKKNREKVLKKNQREEPPFTDHMLAICNADVEVKHKASKPKGKNPEAKSRHKKKHPLSNIESSSATDTNPSQPLAFTPVVDGLHKEALQPTGVPTSLGVINKERVDPQLSRGISASNLHKPIFLASFIIHFESVSRCDASADSIVKADPGKSAPHDYIRKGASRIEQQIDEEFNTLDQSSADNVKQDIKLEDLSKLVPTVVADFMDLNSPEDDLIIIVDESKGEEEEEIHATKHTKTDPSPSLLPTKLKELSSKFNYLTEEVKGLKTQVHELEIELPWDLKEIPNKLEAFTSTVRSLTTQVVKLETLQWELPAEYLSVPKQLEMVQAKLKTLDALPSLLNKVTKVLNQFSQAISSASKITKDLSKLALNPLRGRKTQIKVKPPFLSYFNEKLQRMLKKKDKGKKVISSNNPEEEGSDNESSSRKKKLKKFDFVTEYGDHIPLIEEQIKEQKRIREFAKAKAAKHEVKVRKEELVDLLRPDVVSKYYKAKLQYDKYCDIMLNRRAKSRIINYDVLTRKGVITLKVYRKDGTSEVFLISKPVIYIWQMERSSESMSNQKRKRMDHHL